MADIPDLLIPTPEEHAAKKFRFLLLETTSPTGVRFQQHDPDDDLPSISPPLENHKIWRFNDEEALHLFAAASMRILRRNGTNATRAPIPNHEHCYDSRTGWTASYDRGGLYHLAW